VVLVAQIQRPGGPQNSWRPGPVPGGSENRYRRISGLRPTSEPWGSVGARNTTPGVRHCERIPDLL